VGGDNFQDPAKNPSAFVNREGPELFTYPNPTLEDQWFKLHIGNLPLDEPLLIQMKNSTGQVLFSRSRDYNKGEVLEIPMESPRPGMYYVSVFQADKEYSLKILVGGK